MLYTECNLGAGKCLDICMMSRYLAAQLILTGERYPWFALVASQGYSCLRLYTYLDYRIKLFTDF